MADELPPGPVEPARTAACTSCGAVYDRALNDDCPVCALSDRVDALIDDMAGVQDAIDQLADRIPTGVDD